VSAKGLIKLSDKLNLTWLQV